MFLVRFRAGRKFENPLWWYAHLQANFFAQFANRARIVLLAGVDMAGGRRIPHARLSILEHRAFLEEKLAGFIEDQDMNRAMHEPKSMHLAPPAATDHLVQFVYDIKYFFNAHLERLHAQCFG